MKLKDLKLNKLIDTHIVYLKINDEPICINDLPLFVVKSIMRVYKNNDVTFNLVRKTKDVFTPYCEEVVLLYMFITISKK